MPKDDDMFIVEGVKEACIDIVSTLCEHMCHAHAVSEREQEILQKFAAGINEAVSTIYPDENSPLWRKS